MKRTLLLLISFIVFSLMYARDLSGCQKWGYAPNDFSQLGTISYLVSPGDYGEGVKMPRSAEWADCTIEGVSVPVALTSITNLRCIVATDAKFSQIIASVEVPEGSLTQGYNDIQFEDPIPVPDKDVYVGYTYHSSLNGASLVVYEKGKSDGGLYLNMSGSWLDYSPYGMGVSGLQVIIGSQKLNEYDVRFRSVEWENVLCGNSSLCAVMRSSSKHPIDRFNYSVTIGDEQQSGELVLSTPIPEGMDKDFVVEIPFVAPAEPCSFEAILKVESVCGNPNADEAVPLVSQLNSVSRRVSRNTVVEEFTGTRCGYCPKGWLGMETLKERYGDRFIGVAIHQYNSDDPMYNKSYARLGFIGAPSCKLDRNTEAIDPYNGSGFYSCIVGDFEHANSLLPDVEVSVQGTLSDDQRSVVAEMNAEFLGNAHGYSVGYVLTADGLSGSGAWLQENYYYSLQPSAVVNDELPELAMFCAGGEKGQSKVSMIFNDVMIASSWDEDGKSLVSSLPTDVAAGDYVSDTYILRLPTNATLLKAIDNNQLYVIALVVDQKGRVANAARARVDITTEVDTISSSQTTDIPVYTIDGRIVKSWGHGVFVHGGRKIVR